MTTWIRVLAVEGPLGSDAVFYLVVLAANAALVIWCRRAPTAARWRLRLLFYPLVMNAVYFQLGGLASRLELPSLDPVLARIDAALLGVTPSVALEPFSHPALTEVMSLGYLFFYPYLAIAIFGYLLGDLPTVKRFYSALFTVYGVGYLCYTLVPAQGPHLALSGGFTDPLEGWLLRPLSAAIVWRGSNGIDVFPSLHCAVSAAILFFDRRHAPWRFRWCLLPCICLWCATVYLRYHYLVDVLAGFALAAVALRLARRTDASGVSAPSPARPRAADSRIGSHLSTPIRL